MNKKSSSASELLILLSQKLFTSQTTTIGGNTNGCLTYINVFQILPPNRSFGMSMSFSTIEEDLKCFASWKGEGVGIEPDIMCSDAEILQILRKLTKDKSIEF